MTALEPLNIVRPFKLRVADFLLLDEAGAFAGHGKTELIDGTIVYMNAQHRPHARLKVALYDALKAALKHTQADFDVLIEVTVAMPPNDAPEPDLVLTSEADGEGPVPVSSIALIVEIADTTLDSDLGAKRRLYAAHHVPEYWVADVGARMLHQMWAPSGGDYTCAEATPLDKAVWMRTMTGVALAPVGR